MQVEWSGVIELNETNVSKIPRGPGVYRLSAKQRDGGFYVFYVGQAENLQERILQHLSESETNECIRNRLKQNVCAIKFALVDSQEDRDGIEQHMYNRFEHACNVKNPGKPPIEVNLN